MVFELQQICKPESERKYCQIRGCPLLADFIIKISLGQKYVCEYHRGEK